MPDESVTKSSESSDSKQGERSTGGAGAKRRGRATVSIALLVVASLLLPLAGLTVWVRNLVLDSSRYVETVAPLSKDPAVREAVAARVASSVVSAVDLETRAKRALPKRAAFLAAPIANASVQLAHATALKILQSSQFDRGWRLANQRAHDQIVNALTGRPGPAVTKGDGKVVVNLGPLAERVIKKLATLGIGVPKNLDVSRLNVRYVLIDSSDLKSVQSYARLLDRLGWILPLVTVLLYAIAVLIAPRRRKAVQRVGVGIAVAMTASVIAYGLGRTLYLDNLPANVQGQAAGAVIFDTVTRFIELGFRTMLVIGLLVWSGAWLAGPSRPAAALRRQWGRLSGKSDEGEINSMNRWVATNATGLRAGLFGVLLLVLVAWDRPTGVVVLALGVVALLGLGVIQVLGAGGPPGEAPVGAA